jgi:NitT/TauT family transport system substrate-binding protein
MTTVRFGTIFNKGLAAGAACRMRKATLCAFAMVGSMAVTGSAAQAFESVTLQLSWLPQGQASALFYGMEQGCFASKNLELTVKRGYGAADAVTKVATNAAEFGVADLGSVITARAQGKANVKAIMPIFSDSPLLVAVLSSSPIQSLKDLEGKSLAAGPGEGGSLIIPLAMRNEGGDMTKVDQRTVEPAALAGALLQGQVDGIISYTTTAVGIGMMAKPTGKSLRTLDFGKKLGIYGDAIFTTDQRAQDNSDLVNRFRDAVRCSYEAARKNPEAAVAVMTKKFPEMVGDREVVLAKVGFGLIFDSPSPALAWDIDRVKRTVDVTKAAQNLPGDVDTKSVIAQ